MLAPWKESYDKPIQHIKKQRCYFVDKGLSSQIYGFSSSHVWMWELEYKESWAEKNWCYWTVVLEKTLESPLEYKEIQPVHPKRNQSWIFIGRIDAEAETPILWPPDVKSWLIGKDPDAGRHQEEEKAGGEGDNRGWDGWMASPTQWTWVWARSGSWSWTGKPCVLQSMGLQKVGHDWVTELNWIEILSTSPSSFFTVDVDFVKKVSRSVENFNFKVANLALFMNTFNLKTRISKQGNWSTIRPLIFVNFPR